MTSTDPKISDISIIIPTLNEEANIAPLADSLRGEAREIIIVDGGSTDETVRLATERGLRVEYAAGGRAAQLNYGAVHSTGNVLLFLHADTRLPAGFSTPLLRTLSLPGTSLGAFSLAVRNAGPALRVIARCANLRARYMALPYGDQGIFVTREQFFHLGGYPPVPIMEDFLLVRKARSLGRIRILEEKAVTSDRRWRRRGILRTTLINQMVVLGYYLGVAPERLASFYRR